MQYALILTCEHVSNAIPKQLNPYFIGKTKLLTSHCGWDIGAEQVFKYLKSHLPCHSYSGKYSRLVIDLNRSLHNQKWLIPDQIIQEQLIRTHYLPYRQVIKRQISRLIKKNFTVIHLAIHSFTPQLKHKIRNCNLGILYDPKINLEKTFAINLKRYLINNFAELSIRMNYPYLGISDGLTSSLRKIFRRNYIGIELEFNQKLFNQADNQWLILTKQINNLLVLYIAS